MKSHSAALTFLIISFTVMKVSYILFSLHAALAFGGTRGSLAERVLSQAKASWKRTDVAERNGLHGKHPPQYPITAEPYHAISKHSATLEIHSVEFLGFLSFFYTNIALGTPNQAFRMLLDLSYGGLLVRGPSCDSPYCGHGFEYNHSTSSTYHNSRERFSMHLPAQYVYGNVSRDELQLASLGISNVSLGEVDDFYGENWIFNFLSEQMDGYRYPASPFQSNELMVYSAIGLGPPNAAAPVYTDTMVPNILASILSAGILDRDVMTLSLPSKSGEQGLLLLGALPEGADDDYIRLPLINATAQPVANSWLVKIDNVALRGNNSIEIPLDDIQAAVELDRGFTFPSNVTQAIIDAVGAKYSAGDPFPSFNCSRWDSLPDLVLTFSGHDVVLAKGEYTDVFYQFPDQDKICALLMNAGFDDKAVVLGIEFIRKFHTVFDIETKELGRKPI